MKLIIFFSSLFFSLFSNWLFSANSSPTRSIYDNNGKLTAKFTCYEGKPTIRTFYIYDSKGRILKMITDNGFGQEVHDMTGVTERFLTSYRHHPEILDQDHPTEILQKYLVLQTGVEKLILHTFNNYDKEHRLIQRELIDFEGTYTHMTFDKEGKPMSIFKCRKEGEQERMTLEYDTHGRLLSVSKETREGITELIYDSNGFPVIKRPGIDDYPYSDQPWAPAVAESVEFLSGILSSFQKTLERLSFSLIDSTKFHHMEEETEKLLINLMDSRIYQLSGYYTYAERSGVFGNGEIHDKVRISLINGILNEPSDHMQNLDIFSNTHGGVNIHYIFRPYQGYTPDVLKCFRAKNGWISPSAHALAKKWKELIAEMGGIHGGGLIIHYAHSIGGTDTYRAKALMTPEELKMIRVYTIGSPTLIADEGFQKVVNYTSVRDAVSVVDPISYLSGLLNVQNNIIFVGTIWGIPGIDHLITNPAYKKILEDKGREFLEAHSNLPATGSKN